MACTSGQELMALVALALAIFGRRRPRAPEGPADAAPTKRRRPSARERHTQFFRALVAGIGRAARPAALEMLVGLRNRRLSPEEFWPRWNMLAERTREGAEMNQLI